MVMRMKHDVECNNKSVSDFYEIVKYLLNYFLNLDFYHLILFNKNRLLFLFLPFTSKRFIDQNSHWWSI